MLRVGILGGTFNPPHIGHLRLAEEVAPMYGLERVVFIPCHVPPHKTPKNIAAARHRLEMTRRACEDNPLFEVSDMEIAEEGPSYTVKTLRKLAATENSENYFIMGTDSLREIGLWKDYDSLFSLAHFIVVSRPGSDFEAAWAEVPAKTREAFTDSGDFMLHASSKTLAAARARGLDISSTQIRNLVRQGRSVRYLVTESVRSYIDANLLYRNS